MPSLRGRSCCLIEGQPNTYQKEVDGAECMIKGRSFLNYDEKHGNQSAQGVRNSLIGLGHHIQNRAVVREKIRKAKTGHQVLRKGCGWHADGFVCSLHSWC